MGTATSRALLVIGALLVSAGSARADLPPFTPNVVDPAHYLSKEETQEINEVIAAMRARTDTMVAVYVTDRLGDDTIETLSNRAFDAWRLGERGKDNGLLLVLAMAEHKMRFATGYGLEGDLPDAICRRALDDYLRPRLRRDEIKDGVIEALYFLARTRTPGFELDGRRPPRPPATAGQFDARAGLFVWGGWVVLLGWLFFRRVRFGFNGRLGIFAFLCVNPGAFIFIGTGFLYRYRDVAWKVVLDHLALPPFYALVALAAGAPIRIYQRVSVERMNALYAKDAALRALGDRLARLSGRARSESQGSIAPAIIVGVMAIVAVLIVGVVWGLDYRQPFFFLIPAAVFGLSWHLGNRALRTSASPDALRASLEEQIRIATARMEALALRGHATRNDDGSYTYTAAYYASQSSAGSSGSSSSSSDFSSSSGGGSSGGGGASSDW